MTSKHPPEGWTVEGGDWGKVAKRGPGDRGVVLHRAPKKKPPRILTMREWSSACVAGALYRFDGGVFMEKSTRARMFVRWYRDDGRYLKRTTISASRATSTAPVFRGEPCKADRWTTMEGVAKAPKGAVSFRVGIEIASKRGTVWVDSVGARLHTT